MDLVKKYRLVPLDQHQEFSDEHLSDLDKQIQDILKKRMNDDEKAKLYAQALQKYVTFPNVNTMKPNVEEEPSVNSADIESKILNSVPVKRKNTAVKILDFLKQHEISWSPNKELKQNNSVIPGSDILQLINFLVRDRTRKPAGFEEFKQILDMKNFPQDFIKNKYLTDEKTVTKMNHSPTARSLYAKPKRRKIAPISWVGKMHLQNSHM